jgi:hypothetical protein
MRATTLFNRRARKSARKDQHAQIRPQQGETPALGQPVYDHLPNHQLRQRQQHRHARQALAALLAAVAALIDPEGFLHHLCNRCYPGLGLHNQAAERHTTALTAGQTEHMGPESLAPTVQRRVRGGALAEQIPNHATQAHRSAGITAHHLADHRHRILLVGQDVVGQNTRSGAAVRATRQYDRGLQGDADKLPEFVTFQQDHSTRDDRGTQYQRLAEVLCAAPIIGDKDALPVADTLPEAAPRRYDRGC